MEGLWSATFLASEGSGAGIVVFETQRVFGGDSGRIYLGSYEINERKIIAAIRVSSFLVESEASVFGDTRDFELQLSGDLPSNFSLGSEVELEGVVKDTKAPILIKLIKRAELPNAH